MLEKLILFGVFLSQLLPRYVIVSARFATTSLTVAFQLAISEPYAGEPIDVWSAGVVLFALLVGSESKPERKLSTCSKVRLYRIDTPWDEPTTRSPEFSAYLDGTIWNVEPWNRLRESSACCAWLSEQNLAFTETWSRLALLLKMLHPDPGKRCTLAQVSRHDWFAQ